MAKGLNHQRLNTQKRTIDRGWDSKKYISDEVWQSMETYKTYSSEVLVETQRDLMKTLNLLSADSSSKSDERARIYLQEVINAVGYILRHR
jgi:hypothetical protein